MRKQETIKLYSNQPMVVFEANDKGEAVESTKTIDFGRDTGKTFRITEMSAMQLEKWHVKMISLMKESFSKAADGVIDIYEKHSATLAFAALSNKSIADAEKYLELLNEHLYCYEVFNKDSGEYMPITRENLGNMIDEVGTLQYLRDRAVQFNLVSFIKGNTSGSLK